MTLPLAVQLGVITAMVLMGALVERRLAKTDPLLSVSRVTRLLVVGLALTGPFVLLNRGVLTGWLGLEGIVVALGCSLVLYTVAGRLVGVRSGGDCQTGGRARADD